MNRLSLIAAALAAALIAMPGHQAQAATYCLVGEIDQCTFTSLEQCLEAANGVAGFCVIDTDAVRISSPRGRKR